MTVPGRPTYEFLKAHAHVVKSRTQQAHIEKPYAMPVAVSREIGSGGDNIAERLAERLGFHFYDKEVLVDIASRMKVPVDVLNRLDEKAGGFLDLYGSSFFSGYSVEMSELERHLKLTIAGLLKMGSAVIVGRGSTLIAIAGHAMRLRIIAPLDQRIETIARRYKITEKEALSRIHTVEVERQEFRRTFFGNRDIPSDSYDLALSTQQFSAEECVDLAAKAYHLLAAKEPAVSAAV